MPFHGSSFGIINSRFNGGDALASGAFGVPNCNCCAGGASFAFGSAVAFGNAAFFFGLVISGLLSSGALDRSKETPIRDAKKPRRFFNSRGETDLARISGENYFFVPLGFLDLLSTRSGLTPRIIAAISSAEWPSSLWRFFCNRYEAPTSRW